MRPSASPGADHHRVRSGSKRAQGASTRFGHVPDHPHPIIPSVSSVQATLSGFSVWVAPLMAIAMPPANRKELLKEIVERIHA